MFHDRLISTLPNALSLTRLALGLAFPWLPVSWRIAVVVVAAVTDILDGATSRHWQVASRTGRLLDPIADKVFMIGVVATLWHEGMLAGWEILLVGLRDLVIIAGVLWLLATSRWSTLPELPPSLLGKLTTAAQMLLFFGLLVCQEPAPLVFWPTAALSGLAAADYLWRFRDRQVISKR